MLGNRGSRFDTGWLFSVFFNIVEKHLLIVKKISKCRENGIDRLRNGQLLRWIGYDLGDYFRLLKEL